MKKFNVKVLLIGLLIVIGLVALVITTFGQNNPPSNLNATVLDENDVNLTWFAPSTGDSTYLHWDSGENEDSFGNFLNPATYLFAAKFDPAHIADYDGWQITQLRFWLTNPLPTVKIKVWTGPDATEIYSQDVPVFNIFNWTEIEFDSPVTIDASTELWFGLYVDMPVPGAVMGTDSGPGIDGYGNMYKIYGTWYHDFSLNWNIQAKIEQPSLPVSLHWDSGENADSWGFWLGSAQFSAASKWDPAHITPYDNWEVTEMRFYVVNPLPTLKLKIWSGPNATEIYSQDINTFNIYDWTVITLDNPVTIDASTQLWAGLYVDMPAGGAVMGLDEGPGIDGYGNMYKYGGNWYHDVGANWNIQITIENPNKNGIKGLLGYNVYRNGEQINENIWGGIAYVDENLLNGSYDYYVTAVYDEGESDPSNMVNVIINQPVIAYADSMALVDLYNNCNGPNWLIKDLWLEGPVNEWYGVITTGTRVTGLWRQSNNLIGDIPESFGDLTALEVLHIESNEIYSIPESIGNLTLLEELWLGWTPISTIPESFGNLVNLQELHLGLMVTPLGTLPESFGNLVNLEWLALGGSGLNSLPESFGNLTSVKTCFLWENNLTELPESIGGMESLKYLNLDNNYLSTLPESFGNLNNLGYLFIEENQITHFPESFGGLESLDSLWARFNQIEDLPENFGDLDDLNFLRLEYNMISELPASFTDLATIEELYLYDNQLEFLPANFGNLNTIKLLDIGANNLHEIPESIGDLSLLNIFAANGNFLTSIPESFGNLEPDTVFIHNNQIAELPSTLFDNDFQFFWIKDNNLQFGSIEPFMNNAIGDFWYDPQAMIGQDTTFEVINNETLSYTIEVSGENNIYSWYKDGTLLPGQTSTTLYIENASYDDQGTYVLKVTNTIVPELELVSYEIELTIIEIILPAPENLSVQSNINGDIELTWDAPLFTSDFFEGFEGSEYPPEGWIIMNPDGGTGWQLLQSGINPLPGWSLGSSTSCPDGGDFQVFATWLTGGPSSNDQWLVTPEITVYDGFILSFWLDNHFDFEMEYMEVLISTTVQDDTSAFEILVDSIEYQAGSATGWTQYMYNLTEFVAPGTPVYIAFREKVPDNYNSGALSLDNIFVGASKSGSNKSSKEFIGYYVYYSLDGGVYSTITYTTDTSYIHENPGYGNHCYYVTAFYDPEGESDPTNTECESITKIEENIKDRFHVFPNPVAGNTINISVNDPQTIDKFIIMNGSGKVVKTEKLTHQNNSIDISDLAIGIYFIKIINKNESYLTEKLIVK